MSVDIAIVTHPYRQGRATELAYHFDGAELIVDTDGVGCTRNHLRAWHQLVDSTADWGLVIEDDAIPCLDFESQLQQVLWHAPSPIVSLYLGQGRPPHWQSKARRAVATQRPFIVSTSLLHAVAVAVRVDFIPGMIAVAEEGYLAHQEPIDEGITRWAKSTATPVSYSNPSIVDHDADLPSLAEHQYDSPDPAPRRAHWFGTRGLEEHGPRSKWGLGLAVM